MSSFKFYEMWLILGRWSQLSCTQVMKCPFLLLWNACCISSYSVRQENGFMLSDHSASMTSAFSEEVCVPVFKVLYTSSSVFLSVFNFDISNTNHYNFFLTMDFVIWMWSLEWYAKTGQKLQKWELKLCSFTKAGHQTPSLVKGAKGGSQRGGGGC